MTGELKCRGFFVDENALDASAFHMDFKYDTTPKQVHHGDISLCVTLRELRSHIDCHSHQSSEFDVARIVPTSNAVQPNAEAVVLVVPPPKSGKWESETFYYLFLQLIQRLSQPQSSPWLAKTILVVSSSQDNIPLEVTVSQFLSAYLGPTNMVNKSNTVEGLPSGYTSAMIRNLLVLNVEINESGPSRNELLILPQGRRGVLPNMDLVFVAVSVFSRARFLDDRQQRHDTSTSFVVHPYVKESSEWKTSVDLYLPSGLRHWANSLGNLGLFSYSLIVGPYPPHAAVLDCGIDSLTLTAHFGGQPRGTIAGYTVEYVQNVEQIVRALSNLHERLHHSISFYLLPSPTTFVSQAEYLVPTILLLLPLVLRAGMLAFVELKGGIHLRAMGCGISLSLLAALYLLMMSSENPTITTTHIALLYTCAYVLLREISGLGKRGDKAGTERKQAIQSFQFVTCLIALYVHVPLMFAHVSLAYPSALLWVPLLSFPSYGDLKTGFLHRTFLLLTVLGTWPPLWLALRVFGSYTDFVRFVYTPLHLLLSSLCFLTI